MWNSYYKKAPPVSGCDAEKHQQHCSCEFALMGVSNFGFFHVSPVQ